VNEPPGDGVPVHAGVLIPWANSVVEAELHHWTGNAVIWHYARLVPSSGTTALDRGFLTGLLDAVPAALAQLSALPLRRVYLACTSAAFMYPERAGSAARYAKVAVVSAFDAITAVLSEHDASRVVLLTPYPQGVTDTEARMFSQCGVTVTACASLGLDDGYWGVTRDQIGELIGKISDEAIGQAEAVVLSCTGWPTFGLVRPLRKRLGKPVISSNLAMAWHAKRALEGR
jgi:maleate isomerase